VTAAKTMVGGHDPVGLQWRGYDTALKAGRGAAASAPAVAGRDDDGKNRFPRSAHRGGFDASCLLKRVEEAKRALDLRFHNWRRQGRA
jgi:hypothetical protein